MTAREKQAFKNMSEDDLIMSHFGWAVNMRNEFGLWQGNEYLTKSCGTANPDDASMVIVNEVWRRLNNSK